MQKNVGNIDRGIRGVIGVLLLMIFFVAPPANPIIFWGFLIVGLVMVGTAALGFCPPYAIFGLNTCSMDKPEGGQ